MAGGAGFDGVGADVGEDYWSIKKLQNLTFKKNLTVSKIRSQHFFRTKMHPRIFDESSA